MQTQQAIPSRDTALTLKHQAHKQLTLINRAEERITSLSFSYMEMFGSGEMRELCDRRADDTESLDTDSMGSRASWYRKARDGVNEAVKHIHRSIEHGTFGLRNYLLLELDPNDESSVELIMELLSKYFPKHCLMIQGDTPTCIYYDPSLEPTEPLSATVTVTTADPDKPATGVILSREIYLKQKYDAMKQLSIINDLEHTAKTRTHPNEYAYVWRDRWEVEGLDSIVKIDVEILSDIDYGLFGMKFGAQTVAADGRIEHNFGIRRYLLFELEKDGCEDSRLASIISFFSEYYPRQNIVFKGARPIQVYYDSTK